MQLTAWEMRAVVDCLTHCAEHGMPQFSPMYLSGIAGKVRDELDGIKIEVHPCGDAAHQRRMPCEP